MLGYGADVVVLEPPQDVRDSVVRRLREAAGRGGAARMSGARDQVGRLLALVPYIQARREVSLEQAAGRLRGLARPRSSRTSTCCGSAGCRGSAWAT